MAYTSINDPSAHFQVKTYSGTGSTTSITNDGNSDLQPDWIWIKKRNLAASHMLGDSTRGTTKYLSSDVADAESTATNRVTAFNSNGFSLGNAGSVNNGSHTYVAWQWKANGGTTSSNTDGSITSTVQANTDAGFSIVTFTGNGSNDATIGHGLGTTPAMIITKNRDDSVSWRVWHQDLTSTYMLFINSNNSQTSPSSQGNGYIKTVGSSTYSVYQGTTDTNGVNGSSDNMIAYCFAEKQGYSKFGKYEGNGNADGPFVYTGFKPAFILFKNADRSEHWWIFDGTRSAFNVATHRLSPSKSDAEATNLNAVDFLSNGFKIRSNTEAWNYSNNTIVYMAFAENPFVTSTGIPTTAR